jgi:hypothetical protein
MIYRIPGEHTNLYTTDAVNSESTNSRTHEYAINEQATKFGIHKFKIITVFK